MPDSRSAKWLYEAGIGEERAILISGGILVEAHINRPGGLKYGQVVDARFVKKLGHGTRGIAVTDGGREIMISPLPSGLAEGECICVVIKREAIAEKGRYKFPLGSATSEDVRPAPSLLGRLEESGIPIQRCSAHGADHFRDAGWQEVMEEADSGVVRFARGSLLIDHTPALTAIDIDGELPPRQLALAAAPQVARAIRRLRLQGSMVIDFPDAGSKTDRAKVAEAFDNAMVGDYERTAINGFGLMQVVTRRMCASLPEIIQNTKLTSQALQLLRSAERSGGTGEQTLTAHPAIVAKLKKHGDWTSELVRRSGRQVILQADAKLAIGAGHVS